MIEVWLNERSAAALGLGPESEVRRRESPRRSSILFRVSPLRARNLMRLAQIGSRDPATNSLLASAYQQFTIALQGVPL